jgi:hypothetical protein
MKKGSSRFPPDNFRLLEEDILKESPKKEVEQSKDNETLD